MKIFVTGGTGLLGGRLIPKLVENGHKVFALARSSASQEKVRALGALPITGDLDGDEPLSLPTVDAVVHAAALFRFGGPTEPYFRINVNGTIALLGAAELVGAEMFVHISAAGIIMDDRGSPVRNADESAPTYPNSFIPYLASKARAESAVLKANKPGFRTIALRPSAIWGPGDQFSTLLPRAIASGQFAFIDRGDYAVVTCHVDNAVEGISCALTRGTGGRAYFINDREKQSFREFISMIASAHGSSIDKLRSMPYRLAFGIGRIMEMFARVTFRKSDPPLSRAMVRMIGQEFTTNDAAARRELDYVGTRSRAEGVQMYRAARKAIA